jgi:hypothetical protein
MNPLTVLVCQRCGEIIDGEAYYVQRRQSREQPGGPVHVSCPTARQVRHRRRMGRDWLSRLRRGW